MKIKGLPLEKIEACARRVGEFKLYNTRQEGNYWCFTLRMAINMGKDGYRKAPPGALRFRKRGYSAHYRGSDAFGGNGAVCFHGHKLFMLEVLHENPEAVIRTAKATYKGLKDFHEKWPAVGRQNVGSMMYPVSYDASCDCQPSEIYEYEKKWGPVGDPPFEPEHRVRFSTLEHDEATGQIREVKVRMIRQSDLLRCPFAIMVPDHYRDDGTCRCDEQAERDRMIAEWDYKPEHFKDIPLRKEA